MRMHHDKQQKNIQLIQDKFKLPHPKDQIKKLRRGGKKNIAQHRKSRMKDRNHAKFTSQKLQMHVHMINHGRQHMYTEHYREFITL